MSTADESCTPEESTSAGCSSLKRTVCSRHRKSQRSVQGGCAFFKRSHKNARSKRNQKNCDGLLSEECDGDIEIVFENIKEPNPKKLKCQRNELFVGDCERNSSNWQVDALDGDQEILRLRFPNLKMSVRLADFITLSNGALLNDTIVDFYLNHIVENVLPDCGSSQIFVLPSLFWHRLRTSSNPLEEFSVGINKESGICFTKEYRTYINFWINEVNIFEASFIVIPVIEQSHWMLVIVCLPSDFLGAMERGSVSDGDLKSRGGATRRPKMIFFDSQQKTGDSNLVNGVCTTVRQLLMYILKERYGDYNCDNNNNNNGDGECGNAMNMSSEVLKEKLNELNEMPYIIPKCLPQQENNIDCGIYILEYARCFLLRQPANLWSQDGSSGSECDSNSEGDDPDEQSIRSTISNDLHSESFDFAAQYPEFSVASKRCEIQKTLLSLCLNAEKWRGLLDADELNKTDVSGELLERVMQLCNGSPQ